MTQWKVFRLSQETKRSRLLLKSSFPKIVVYAFKLIVSADGSPVEFAFTLGSMSDIKAFQNMQVNLPKGAKIYADRAYNDYAYEDLLKEALDIELHSSKEGLFKKKA